MDDSGNKKLSVHERLAYSFGAFGNDAFYGLMSGWLVVFVTSHLFNSGNKAEDAKIISIVTALMMVIRIVELFIDPFVGNAIDRTKTRWGHFRPWIVAGGSISSILLLILFSTMGNLYKTSPFGYVILFAVLYIIMQVFYAFKDTGFWSMMPSLSLDSREREKTATWARVGSTIGGGLIGILVMPAVVYFSLTKTTSGDTHGWFMFAMIVCIITFCSAWCVGLFNREVNSKIRKNKQDTTLKGVFKVLAGNDQLMWVALAYLTYGIAINITGSLEIYYFTYICGAPQAFSIMSTINVIMGVIASSIFAPISKKFSRKLLFSVSLIILLIGLGVFTIAGKSVPLAITACVLFGLPQQLVFLVVLMVITDSVEYGQLKMGHRDESLTLSVRPLIDKFGGAISNGVVGQVAVIAGMTTGATASSITAAGQMKFKVAMLLVPAIFLVLSIFIFCKKVILSDKEHAKIVAKLEKTWGKQFNNNSNEHAATSAKLNVNVKTIALATPVSGELLDLKNVSDPAFANGKMGKGFAIKPNDGRILAPFDGEITQTFATRHAIAVKSNDGMVILIHIGKDTASLNGTGFVQYVIKNQKVRKGQELIEFWDPTIKKAGLDDTVMVTVMNSKDYGEIALSQKVGVTVNSEANVLTIAEKK